MNYLPIYIFHKPKTAETLDFCKIIEIVIIIIIIIMTRSQIWQRLAKTLIDIHTCTHPTVIIISSSSFRVGIQLYILIILLLPKK